MATSAVELEKPIAPRSTLRMAGFQVFFALGALMVAWTGMSGRNTPWSATVWAALSLAAFAGGRAAMNALGYHRRSTALQLSQTPQRLAVRLEPESGDSETQMWLWFPMAIGYAPPVLPLVLLAFRLNANRGNEALAIPVVGAALICALFALLGLSMGLRHVYLAMTGSKTEVEAAEDHIRPGQTVPLFISHHPGRMETRDIQLSLVCQETVKLRKHRAGKPSTTVYETRTLHDIPIPRASAFEAPRDGTWTHETELTIPAEARPSTALDYFPTIVWNLHVAVTLANAPDYTLKFPLTVVE